MGLVHSSSPTTGPEPVTTFSTPGGRPHSAATAAISSAVSGVSEAGFSTRQLPMIRAGAIFHIAIMNGRFQGTMPAQTPMGSRLTKFQETAGMSTQGSGS